MKEKPYRSVVKSVSWRAIGTIDTITIAWLVVGRLNFAIAIGGIEFFTKMLLYFLHERAWNRISFGKVKATPADYEI
jgi:uncharacterized membrane protein